MALCIYKDWSKAKNGPQRTVDSREYDVSITEGVERGGWELRFSFNFAINLK